MECINQPIDGERGVLFGDLAEVGITRRCGWAGMAEQCLDMAQTQTLFEQVRGVAVAQGMERDFFLIPQVWTTAFIAA